MNGPVLEVRNLVKRYSAFTAVRDVSFTIRNGETLGILGPNGAGKSTIVKSICGLIRPSHGSIFFHGENSDTALSQLKRQLGYVPEQPDLYGFLTGWEYLEMVATLRSIPRKQFRAKAAALLEGFGLSSSRDVAIGTYSKGMRQRIVLIAAMLHDPEVLILDEPFSGLDVTNAMVLRGVIEKLAGRGKAILFSSPVLEQMERLCSHLVVLNRGAVVARGSMAELREEFEGRGIEEGFMELTQQIDSEQVAGEIVEAVVA
jgi:ABC-2 type transport system ATP-binding protein